MPYSRSLLVYCCCLVTKSCPTLCDPMDCSIAGSSVLHHLLELAQTPCPLSQWCNPTISSSVVPFSSCPQSFPESESFPMSQLFSPGGQSVGALAIVLPMNIQDWLIWSKSLHHHYNLIASVLQHSAFFMVHLSHLYMTTGKAMIDESIFKIVNESIC